MGREVLPVAPSHPTPEPTDRELAGAKDLPKVLERFSSEAAQGTVARSGEVLVLTFEDILAEDRAH